MSPGEQDSSAMDWVFYGLNAVSIWGTDEGYENAIRSQMNDTLTRIEDVLLENPEAIAHHMQPHFQGLSSEIIQSRIQDGERHSEMMAHSQMMTNQIVVAFREGVKQIVTSQQHEHQKTREAIEAIMNNAVRALSFCIQETAKKIIESTMTSPRQALLRLLNRDDSIVTVENIETVQEGQVSADTVFNAADIGLLDILLKQGGAELFVKNTVKNDPNTLLLFLEVETSNPHWKRSKYLAFQQILNLAQTPDPKRPKQQMQMASVNDLLLLLGHAEQYEETINEMHLEHGEDESKEETNYYRTKIFETLHDIAYGDKHSFNSGEQIQARLILLSAKQLSPEEEQDMINLLQLANEMAQKRGT